MMAQVFNKPWMRKDRSPRRRLGPSMTEGAGKGRLASPARQRTDPSSQEAGGLGVSHTWGRLEVAQTWLTGAKPEAGGGTS